MSIINALLTGGMLIGKVCQALSPGESRSVFVHEESSASFFGVVESGGVTFYRKNVDGKSTIYAANTSPTSYASIAVPNSTQGNDQGGVTYVIQPLEKIPFDEAENPLVSPETNITTGLVQGEGNLESVAGGGHNLFKLGFKGLTFGKYIYVGPFRLSCTTTQLTILSTSLLLSQMTYFYFNSDKGVSAISQNIIERDSDNNLSVEEDLKENSFDINFDSLGIDVKTDTIEGQITCQIDNSSLQELLAVSKVPSVPLDESEIAFFKSINKLA
ncbi:hypothetical protein [Flammeovirga sp. SJP92]|uniref:hypothetical protein n=1 Tax=Flammeovirga sp. SJP92 TaxID=1775430 RepID=UPI0007880F64|nr:hypothetical protein [Flammeovirga sp. SJP92]KXX71174.1 hypothetical protein AVL50_10100 [Flammeovirga sp. SJP92]